MNYSHFRFALPVASLVVALAQVAHADNVVVPGERVGSVRLNATIAQVHKLLGNPSKSVKWKTGEVQDNFLGAKPPVDAGGADKYPRHNLTVIYRAGQVVQIEFNSAAFSTDEGISIESSLSDFRDTYGPLKPYAYGMDEGGYVAYYYDSAANGIAFSFGIQDYFDATINPETIRVHKRGTKVLPDPGGKPQAATDEKPVGEAGG